MASAYDELSDRQFTHGKELIALLDIGRGDRVRDVGCGTRRLAAFTVERVCVEGHIVGIDPAPPRIQVAQQRGDLRLEIRTFTTVFRDVAQIIDFLQATTYGELVPAASAADYAAFAGTLEALFAGDYADRVSSDGIRLERYVLLAVADKPR